MLRISAIFLLSFFLWVPHSSAIDDGILVLGGSGQLGSEIVKDLVENDENVTVLVRPTSKRDRLAGLAINYEVGDILNDADMERIFTSNAYRVVVDASGQTFGGDQSYYEKSQRVISKWSAATNVVQVILHGATGAGDSAEMFMMENVPEPQRIAIASKSIAEGILKNSGVPYTIIRHLTLLPLETKESGKARLTTNHLAIGAVTRDGLARLTIKCLDNVNCLNTTFHAVDDEVKLSGRYSGMWERYRRVIKPYVFDSIQGTSRAD